jgi:hypothetical protein
MGVAASGGNMQWGQILLFPAKVGWYSLPIFQISQIRFLCTSFCIRSRICIIKTHPSFSKLKLKILHRLESTGLLFEKITKMPQTVELSIVSNASLNFQHQNAPKLLLDYKDLIVRIRNDSFSCKTFLYLENRISYFCFDCTLIVFATTIFLYRLVNWFCSSRI